MTAPRVSIYHVSLFIELDGDGLSETSARYENDCTVFLKRLHGMNAQQHSACTWHVGKGRFELGPKSAQSHCVFFKVSGAGVFRQLQFETALGI